MTDEERRRVAAAEVSILTTRYHDIEVALENAEKLCEWLNSGDGTLKLECLQLAEGFRTGGSTLKGLMDWAKKVYDFAKVDACSASADGVAAKPSHRKSPRGVRKSGEPPRST